MYGGLLDRSYSPATMTSKPDITGDAPIKIALLSVSSMSISTLTTVGVADRGVYFQALLPLKTRGL